MHVSKRGRRFLLIRLIASYLWRHRVYWLPLGATILIGIGLSYFVTQSAKIPSKIKDLFKDRLDPPLKQIAWILFTSVLYRKRRPFFKHIKKILCTPFLNDVVGDTRKSVVLHYLHAPEAQKKYSIEELIRIINRLSTPIRSTVSFFLLESMFCLSGFFLILLKLFQLQKNPWGVLFFITSFIAFKLFIYPIEQKRLRLREICWKKGDLNTKTLHHILFHLEQRQLQPIETKRAIQENIDQETQLWEKERTTKLGILMLYDLFELVITTLSLLIIFYGLAVSVRSEGELKENTWKGYMEAFKLTYFLKREMKHLWAEFISWKRHQTDLKEMLDILSYPSFENNMEETVPPNIVTTAAYTSRPPLFAIKNLSFRYDGATGDIFKNLSWGLSMGTHAALTGPSGSGKTTLMKLLLGVCSPNQGAVYFKGTLVTPERIAWIGKHVHYIGQYDHLHLYITKEELRKIRRVPFVNQAIIQRLLSNPVEQDRLSVGERQLILLARSVIQKPMLLMLDEPFTGLGYQKSLEVLGDLKQLIPNIILSTHQAHLSQNMEQKLTLKQVV